MSRLIIFRVLLIISFGNPFFLFAQRVDNQLEWVDVDETLSNSTIRAIVQDHTGFMWFGTNNGLFRFDGHNIKLFKHEPGNPGSLSNSSVNALLVDNTNNIWIGTLNGGLDKLDLKTLTFTHYKHNPQNVNSLSSNSINSIVKGEHGWLWVALRLGGIDHFDTLHQTFVHYRHNAADAATISNDEVAAIYNDNNRQLWAGTWFGGLNKLSPDRRSGIYKVQPIPVNFGAHLKNNAVISFAKLKNGNLLIGAQFNGLYVIDSNQVIRRAETMYKWAKAINTATILSIKQTSNGNLYIGTTQGLALVNMADQSLKLYTSKYYIPGEGLKDNEVYSLFEDYTGVLWIGTKKGLNKLVPKRFTQYKPDAGSNELTRNNVLSLVQKDTDNIWIGTWGGGIFQYNLKNNHSVQRFAGNKDAKYGDYIWSLYKDQQNVIWVGSHDKGFYSYNLGTQKFKFYDNILGVNQLQVTCFYEDVYHNFWIGTWWGLIKFNRDTHQLTWFKNEAGNENSISNDFVTAICGTKSGEIWVGTRYEGLNKLSLHSGQSKYQVSRYQAVDSNAGTISNNYISCLYVDSKNKLWIGTEGGGLNSYNAIKNSFTSITSAQGLPNNSVHGILEDRKGNIWLSTNNGLAVFDQQANRITAYNQSDGLQDKSFGPGACYRTSSGFFLFGGSNGFNYFNPDSIAVNAKPVKTIITDFKVFNKSVSPFEKDDDGNVLLHSSIEYTRNITLTHSSYNFLFEFSALDFTNPEKNNYAYRLIGFDKSWIYTSAKNRFAAYTNLKPGTYNFMVKGSNSQGYWNPSVTSVRLLIKPPFWKTIWAFMTYIAILMLTLFMIRKIALARANLNNKLQMSNLERDKDNELNQAKLAFFTNISHEFRTPLTLIIAPLEEMLGKKLIDKADISSRYAMMYKNANRLLRLIDQLMDFRKIESKKLNIQVEYTDVVAFIVDISADFYSLGTQYNKSFSIEKECETAGGWIDKEKVEKIVFNLLSNAFKYTRPGGDIILRIRIDNMEKRAPVTENAFFGNYLSLSVTDTGVGIAPDELEKIFEPFYRSDHNKMQHQPGTGIGLSLVKELIKLHHGGIIVESEPGRGSRFEIELPLDKENYLQDDFLSGSNPDVLVLKHEYGVPETGAGDERLLAKQDILLVIEDNDDVRNYIKDSFKTQYTIIEAKDGKEGLQMAYKHIPDLIICDIMMPELNGVDATVLLKSDIRTSHIPVIILTARSSMEHRLEGLEVGADAYINKPFNMRHLEITIRKLIQTRKALRERFSADIAVNPADLNISSYDEKFLQKAIDLTHKYLADENFSIEQFGSEIGLSRSQLHRKIKALTSQTPSDFVRDIRLKRAAQLLALNKLSISEIAYQTGFNTPAYFTKCFKAHFGIVPSEYAIKHAGIRDIQD